MPKRNVRAKKSQKFGVPRPQLDVGAFRGKWVALDPDTNSIVGHGASLEEARQNSPNIARQEPILYFVPQSDAYFVGGAR